MGCFSLSVLLFWGGLASVVAMQWWVHFTPNQEWSYLQRTPMGKIVESTLGVQLGNKCDLGVASFSDSEGGTAALKTYRQRNCFYPLLPAESTPNLRVKLGVADHGNTRKPLDEKEIIINQIISYEESTEISFNNYTFPKRFRKKVKGSVPGNNDLQGMNSNSKETALFLHFHLVAGGSVVSHKAVKLLSLCDAASRQTKSLIGKGTPSKNSTDNTTVTQDTEESGASSSWSLEGDDVTARAEANSARNLEEDEELTGRCWISPLNFMVSRHSGSGVDLGLSSAFFQAAFHTERMEGQARGTAAGDSTIQQLTKNPLGYTMFTPLVSPDHRVVPSTWHAPLTTNVERGSPNISLEIVPISIGWFSLHRLRDQLLNEYEKMNIGLEDMMIDALSVKKLKARAVEMGLGYIHSLMAVFAFRNDVAFFNKKEIHRGVSRSSVAGLALQSLVSLLYLQDTPEVNSLVLVIHAVETLIAFWKVARVVLAKPKQQPEEGDGPAEQEMDEDQKKQIPDEKKKERKVDPKTGRPIYSDEEIAGFDGQAIKAVGGLCALLFPGYLYYTLIYNEHRSWWSWFITSAAHASYAWGFVLMTPQLWVNYKLKSVAHLPWRAMVYKAFGTFTDDVYAVMVPGVPLAYRLACLRDDIVFILLLGQLWWYPTDMSRANEYGASFDDQDDEKKAEKGVKKEDEVRGGVQVQGNTNVVTSSGPQEDAGGESRKKKPSEEGLRKRRSAQKE